MKMLVVPVLVVSTKGSPGVSPGAGGSHLVGCWIPGAMDA